MADYSQKVLPSGRCVRIVPLLTKAKIDVERFVSRIKGDESDANLETIAQCLKYYTDPRPKIYLQLPPEQQAQRAKVIESLTKLGLDKKAVARAVEAIYGGVIDTDAMLAAVGENDWHKTNPVELKQEGTSVAEIFSHAPDYPALLKMINDASGFGVSADFLIMTEPTTVSIT